MHLRRCSYLCLVLNENPIAITVFEPSDKCHAGTGLLTQWMQTIISTVGITMKQEKSQKLHAKRWLFMFNKNYILTLGEKHRLN